MCGIFGFASSGAPLLDEATLREGLARLRHRGPDAEGVWMGPGVGLAACRLSVIDPPAPAQPVWDELKLNAAVFNGEIYNHNDLRKRLARKAHAFATRTDTEVLVHLYEERGLEMTQDLDGMYAFALWNAPSRRLFLARDPFGIKPLYYAERPEGVLFSSEIGPLAALDKARQVDPEALQIYFELGEIPHPWSVWKGIRKLPPGGIYVWEGGRGKLYLGELPRFGPAKIRDEAEAVHAVREALGAAVESQLAADVPVGVLLSGGIDSSLVAAAAARRRPGIRTFSVGFPDAHDYDETKYARAVAEALGTVHSQADVRAPDREGLGRIVERFGEPFADSSAIAFDAVSALARQEVTVVLSGEGGDELFGGYAERYIWDPVAARLGRLPRWLLQVGSTSSEALALVPGMRETRRKIRKFLAGAPLASADRYRHWFRLFGEEDLRRLLAGRWRSVPNPFAGSFEATEDRPLLHRLMAADLAVTLPGDMLVKSDRMSMGRGLELRVPFLSRLVWEVARRLDPALAIQGRTTKRVLRRLAEESLPSQIARRPKQGFEIPLAAWMQGPWKEMLEDLYEEGGALGGDWFQKSVLRDLGRALGKGERHAAHPLYAALVFSLWQEQWK